MQSLPVHQAQMLRTQFRVWLSLFPPKMVPNSKEIHMQGQGEGPSTLSRDLCSGLVPSWGDRRSRALSLRLLRGFVTAAGPRSSTVSSLLRQGTNHLPGGPVVPVLSRSRWPQAQVTFAASLTARPLGLGLANAFGKLSRKRLADPWVLRKNPKDLLCPGVDVTQPVLMSSSWQIFDDTVNRGRLMSKLTFLLQIITSLCLHPW